MFYFVLAGLCEIGGGYLVWLWLREGKPPWYAVLGAFVLVVYGIPPSSQRISVGSTRHMAVFLLFSQSSGAGRDRIEPDRFDILGGIVALLGVMIIMYWPRPS